MNCCTICSCPFRAGARGRGRDALDAQLAPFFFLRQLFGAPLLSEGELEELISAGDNPSEALPFCDGCYATVLEAKMLFYKVSQLQSQISGLRSGIKDQLFKRNTRRKEVGLRGLIMDKLKGEEEEIGKIADLTLSPSFAEKEDDDMEFFGGFGDDTDAGFDGDEDEFALGPKVDVKPSPARKTPKSDKKNKTRKSPIRVKREFADEQEPGSSAELELETQGQSPVQAFHIKDEPLSSEEEGLGLDDEYVPTKYPTPPKKKSKVSKPKGKRRPKGSKPEPVELPPKEPRIGPDGVLINPVGRPRGRRKPKYIPVPKRLYFCPICSPSWAYTEMSSVVDHLRKEHEPGELVPKHVCDLCSKGYLKDAWLTRHKEMAHKPEPQNENAGDADSEDYEPESSGDDEPKSRWEAVKLRSGPQRELWLDRNLMSAIELRTCQSCHKIFRGSQDLQKHFDLVHEGVEPPTYMCHMCPKIYRQKGSLEAHLKEHDTPTVFRCNYCPLTFPRKGDLVLHFRVHSESGGLLICNICGMGFRHAFSLKRHHLTRHAPDEDCPRFECHICGKVFKQKCSLVLHLDSISHGGTNAKERERVAKRKRDRKKEKEMPVLILPSDVQQGTGTFSGNFTGGEAQVGDVLVEVVMDESV